MKTIAIILITVGIVLAVTAGYYYVTSTKILDIGTLEIHRERNHFINWSPFVGIVLFVGGFVLLIREKYLRN